MQIISLTSIRALFLSIALALVSTFAVAQDCTDDFEPVTDSDATVPVAVLFAIRAHHSRVLSSVCGSRQSRSKGSRKIK